MARRTQVHTIDVQEENPEDLDSPVDIEAGSLSIQTQNNEKSMQKSYWEREPFPFQLPKDGSTWLRFEIRMARIMPPESEGDLKVKRYIVYEVRVRQDTSVADQQPGKIERRYTDFRNLYQSLKKDYPNEMVTIDFPNKVLRGNFSADLIAERSAAFEKFLISVATRTCLRDSPIFLQFLHHEELCKACQYLDERRNELAVPILENLFILLNKVYMDRSQPVLLILCRLVAACTTTPVPHISAERWATMALSRFDTLCDIDLLPLYIPLLHTCAHLWWQLGRDQKPINERLVDMSKKGINTANILTLQQAIHKLDPRAETI